MPPVTFTTARATAGCYRDFIQALRDRLASGEEPHGIPVTHGRSKVPDSQLFVWVELSNGASSESPVTLAVDVTNAYVVAYRTGTRSFFLREDRPAIDKLFPGTKRSNFPFSGSYTDLERVAEQNRANIVLGMKPLANAISALRISNMDQQSNIARSLIVVIQMVAEAARFKYIEDQVTERITTAQVFCPTPTMLRYENCWKKLSKAIQQSNQGVFSNPVQVTDQHGASRNVENINDVAIQDLAIMLFIPKSRSDSKPGPVRDARMCYAYTESANQNQTESHLPLIIVILIFLYAFGLDLKVVAILGLLLLILLK